MVIANSTPLINFAAIRRLDILQCLFGTLIIPSAVEYELLQKGAHHPSASALRALWADLIEIRVIGNNALRQIFRLTIDDGEAEALTLAIESQPDLLLLDDTRARTIAESYGLRVTGSIGCLLMAKQSGIIPAIRPVLDAMQSEARFWVSEQLYRRILAHNHE